MSEAPQLYSARFVVRFSEYGRSFLGSLLKASSAVLTPEREAIISALWDREDRRPTAERLACGRGVPQDPRERDLQVGALYDAGLLLEAGFDEERVWHERQEAELADVPFVDQVELTNACPFTCPFCPRGLGQMNRPVGHLDLGLLARIVEQVAGRPRFKPFGLHHFGDPLLHPDPAAAVRLVAQAGLEPELSVNPILLTEEKAAQLLEAGVGVLIVSMDGLDTATLQKMRGRPAGRFEEAAANVERLIALAARRERPPTVMISMVATTLNRHQWRELFARYRRPGSPWLVPVVRLLEDFGDPAIAPLGVRRLRQLCGAPYKSVSVLWDGTVVPCCHDFAGSIALGNLREQTLAEVWRGEPYRRFREQWKQRSFRPGEPCARCRWRPDLYLREDCIAEKDAWTEQLWPERLLPDAGGSR